MFGLPLREQAVDVAVMDDFIYGEPVPALRLAPVY